MLADKLKAWALNLRYLKSGRQLNADAIGFTSKFTPPSVDGWVEAFI